LFKGFPLGFDFSQVLFGFVFSAFGFQKPFFFPDGADGFFTDLKLIKLFDPFCTEGWEHALKLYNSLFLFFGDVGFRVFRCFGLIG